MSLTPFEKIVNGLRSKGPVKVRGTSATAPCPYHAGKDFNLTVKEYSTGDAWPKCFSHGCTTRQIMEAIGLEYNEGYANRNTRLNGTSLKSLPQRRTSLAGKIAVAEDPVMKRAAEAMGATPDELLAYVDKQKADGHTEEEIKDILNSLASSQSELEPPAKQDDSQFNALTVRPVNDFIDDAKEEAIPDKLFGDLIYQGETIILFGDTGSNKTVHLVQLIDQLSGGKSTHNLECEIDRPLKCLFADFELSKKQFEGRYSKDWKDHYRFSETHFFRAEFNRNSRLPEGINFEDFVFTSLEAEVAEKGIEFLAIDNKSAIKAATEKAHDAGHFMNEWNRIKQRYNLTNVIACHTPKRDDSRPLSINDLAGSKNLSNLSDAVYGIGKSHTDPSVRYIKQFKARSCEVKYGAGNVILYRVTKPSNFLGLEFIGFGDERDHLAPSSTSERGGKRMSEAVAFFQRILAGGPVPIDQVKQEAEEEGIAPITLRRAREQMNIESRYGVWSLPNTQAAAGLVPCSKCGKSCSEVPSGLCIICEER